MLRLDGPNVGDLRRLKLAVDAGGGSRLLRWGHEIHPAGRTAVGLRDYAPGDDLRHIDWRRCAIRDELQTRCFRGDEDRHFNLLVDCSRSMALGRPSKLSLARRLAWVLAGLALTRGDRVGVFGFSQTLLTRFGPARGFQHGPRLQRFLKSLAIDPRATDLAATASALGRLNQPPAPTLVLSDFFDPAGCDRALDVLRRSGCEPRIVQILAADDLGAVELGDVELIDAESGEARRVTLTERALMEYRRRVDRQQASLLRYALRYRLEHVVVRTDWPGEQILNRGLLLARPRGDA